MMDKWCHDVSSLGHWAHHLRLAKFFVDEEKGFSKPHLVKLDHHPQAGVQIFYKTKSTTSWWFVSTPLTKISFKMGSSFTSFGVYITQKKQHDTTTFTTFPKKGFNPWKLPKKSKKSSSLEGLVRPECWFFPVFWFVCLVDDGCVCLFFEKWNWKVSWVGGF